MKNIVQEIDTMLKINDFKQNSILCAMYLDENFSGFDGHFENTPVLPAICYFSIMKKAVSKVLKGRRVTISEIKDAKFFRIAGAKDNLEVNINCSVDLTNYDLSSEIKVDAVFSRNQEKCAKVKAFLKVD